MDITESNKKTLIEDGENKQKVDLDKKNSQDSDSIIHDLSHFINKFHTFYVYFI